MALFRNLHLKFIVLVFLSLVNGFESLAQSKHAQLIDSAEVAWEKMQYQGALIILEDALALSKKSKNQVQITTDLIAIGRTYSYIGDVDKALENYLNALRLSENLKNDSLTFEAVTKLIFYYMEFMDFDMAKEYLDRSEKLAGKLGQKQIYLTHYNSLGIFERRNENFEASIQAYKKALEYTSSSEPYDHFTTIINLSTAYAYSGNVQTAYTYLLRAQELIDSNESMQTDQNNLYLCGQLGRTELLLGNTNKAIEYYLRGFEKSKEIENSEMIRRFSRELARSNATLGNYKEAYRYYGIFVKELQKGHDNEKATAIAEMSAKYEHEKNQQRISNLEKEQKLKAQIHKSQMDRRNLWILVAVLIVCLTIIVAFFVLKNQRNKQRLKLELLENQKELAKQQAELVGQEQERNRLSRELHDGLGGTLASIKMRLSAKNIETLKPLLNDIDAACQDVRNMSHSLSSTFINDIDFYSLLSKLVKDIEQRSSLTVNLEFMPIEELNQLDSERRHQCYRIIQELTNNTIKHAQATELTIGLMKNENDVLLLIEDNGIGFDLESSPSGIGLNNVRKRLEHIGGNLDVSSSLNRGSSFSINFPFIQEYEN